MQSIGKPHLALTADATKLEAGLNQAAHKMEEFRNALAIEVMPYAMRHAKRMARGNLALREYLEDEATLAVVKAMNKYDPDVVKSWRGYAMEHVLKRCRKKAAEFLERQDHMPIVVPMGDEDAEDCNGCIDPIAPDRPSDGEIPLSIEARQLPPELFEAFKLHFVDGHTIAETAKLLGINRETVHTRHVKAAEIIAGNTAPPEPGSPRLNPVERLAILGEQLRAKIEELAASQAA